MGWEMASTVFTLGYPTGAISLNGRARSAAEYVAHIAGTFDGATTKLYLNGY